MPNISTPTCPHQPLTSPSPLPSLHLFPLQLRLAITEIRESKFYRQQQEERLRTFKEDGNDNLSMATQAAMEKEILKPFPSQSHIFDVLEFLRLMTEGHYTEMQDLLREQTGDGRAGASTGGRRARVDLINEVYGVFEALEREIDDPELAKQAIQCAETLTEFCQGNVSGENSRQLVDSKLIDICGRLVLVQDIQVRPSPTSPQVSP